MSYRMSQRKIIGPHDTLLFRSRHTDQLLEVRLTFHAEDGGRTVGARLNKASVVPAGMRLLVRGTEIVPGDERLIGKNEQLVVVDLDGKDYDLFEVQLVDANTDSHWAGGGAVLYFHSPFSHKGLLQEDPGRHLESAERPDDDTPALFDAP